jgi:hypothetical protein
MLQALLRLPSNIVFPAPRYRSLLLKKAHTVRCLYRPLQTCFEKNHLTSHNLAIIPPTFVSLLSGTKAVRRVAARSRHRGRDQESPCRHLQPCKPPHLWDVNWGRRGVGCHSRGLVVHRSLSSGERSFFYLLSGMLSLQHLNTALYISIKPRVCMEGWALRILNPSFVDFL